MKKIIKTIGILLLPFLLKAQCDTALIYANTTSNAVCFDTTFSKVRNCYSNDYPDHDDSYNSPFTVSASNQEYSMCLYPDTASTFTPLYEEVETPLGCNYTYQFGVAINGIGYTPNSNEYFDIIDPSTNAETGEVNIEWHKEARYMFNANFGNNGGHINAFGSYHYHDVPVDYFTDSLEITIANHSSIVGYAADGFPIYYKFVFSDANDTTSAIVALSSGYSLIVGTRPGDGYSAPNGAYTGLYYEDYEYSTTTLDSCNGRWGKTPDYPDGTYYYVLTDNYPYIPRCFKGTVLDNTFRSLSNCPASTASTDCSDAPVEGCTDPFSCNYNPEADIDDGSCDFNYAYDTLTINSCGSYESPSGILYSVNEVFSDTLLVSGGCDTVYNITLTISGATSTRIKTNPTSSGSADGEILFGPPSGTGPYEFSIDSGLTYTATVPPLFSNLTIGDYWTVIKDGNNCEIFEEVSLSVSLPIELRYFKARYNQMKIELSWETASEINSSHFEIERSTDGIKFDFLGKVISHHNTTDLQSYIFNDFDISNERNYYRLKMIDYDGKYEYSNIESITIEDENSEYMIYPNPTRLKKVNVKIPYDETEMNILNRNGKILFISKLEKGINEIPLEKFSAGIYFVKFVNGGEVQVKRLVIHD